MEASATARGLCPAVNGCAERGESGPPGLGMCWRQPTRSPLCNRTRVGRREKQRSQGSVGASKGGSHEESVGNRACSTIVTNNGLTVYARLSVRGEVESSLSVVTALRVENHLEGTLTLSPGRYSEGSQTQPPCGRCATSILSAPSAWSAAACRCAPTHGLPRTGAVGAFQRQHPAPRLDHQDRQGLRAAPADRGCVELRQQPQATRTERVDFLASGTSSRIGALVQGVNMLTVVAQHSLPRAVPLPVVAPAAHPRRPSTAISPQRSSLAFVAAVVAHQLHRFGLTRVQGAEGAGYGHKRHAVDERWLLRRDAQHRSRPTCNQLHCQGEWRGLRCDSRALNER